MSSDDVAAVLNFAADLFEASPIHAFSRADVVSVLRTLPDEISHQMLQVELERAMLAQCAPEAWESQKPS